MYAGTALSNQRRQSVYQLYAAFGLKGASKRQISVGCAACDWKKAGIY